MSRLGPGAIVVVLVGAVVLSGCQPRSATAEEVANDWLRAAAGAERDRGWHYLADLTKSYEFNSDQAAYLGTIAQVDWDRLATTLDRAYEVENGPGMSWWAVEVLVKGGLEAVPLVLFEHGLVQPLCVDNDAPGILLIVSLPAIGAPTVGSGAMTGTARAGRCSSGLPPVSLHEQFLPGQDMNWTGHELEAWNWTEIPLILVHESGRAVDLAACEKVQLDGFGGVVTIRVEDGYVSTVGWDPLEGTTAYLVIGSRDTYLNNAPPAEPLPPCEGMPQVQADD